MPDHSTLFISRSCGMKTKHSRPSRAACAEALAADERRETRMQARARFSFDRQQLAIPPEVGGAPLDQPPAHPLAYGRVVVDHLERSEALLAHPQGLGLVRRFAQMTLQADHQAHG